MVARSLAKAKEGVRVSYTAQDSGNIQQVLIFYFRQIVIPFNVGSIPTLPTINKQKQREVEMLVNFVSFSYHWTGCPL